MNAHDGSAAGRRRGETVRPPERALEPIEAARRRVDQERAEVSAEISAFEAFAARVEAIDAATPAATLPGVPATDGDDADGMSRLREAYRETVMDVDHYDRVYGESLESNLAAEFGPDVAGCVRDGGDAAFTRQFKRAVVAACERTRTERETFLDVLAGEEASLRRAHAELEEALAAVRDDDAGDDEWRTLSARVDAVAAARQRLVHDRVSPGRTDGHDLCEYLYEDAPWTYPVLHAAATLRAAAPGDDHSE